MSEENQEITRGTAYIFWAIGSVIIILLGLWMFLDSGPTENIPTVIPTVKMSVTPSNTPTLLPTPMTAIPTRTPKPIATPSPPPTPPEPTPEPVIIITEPLPEPTPELHWVELGDCLTCLTESWGWGWNYAGIITATNSYQGCSDILDPNLIYVGECLVVE